MEKEDRGTDAGEADDCGTDAGDADDGGTEAGNADDGGTDAGDADDGGTDAGDADEENPVRGGGGGGGSGGVVDECCGGGGGVGGGGGGGNGGTIRGDVTRECTSAAGTRGAATIVGDPTGRLCTGNDGTTLGRTRSPSPRTLTSSPAISPESPRTETLT